MAPPAAPTSTLAAVCLATLGGWHLSSHNGQDMELDPLKQHAATQFWSHNDQETEAALTTLVPLTASAFGVMAAILFDMALITMCCMWIRQRRGAMVLSASDLANLKNRAVAGTQTNGSLDAAVQDEFAAYLGTLQLEVVDRSEYHGATNEQLAVTQTTPSQPPMQTLAPSEDTIQMEAMCAAVAIQPAVTQTTPPKPPMHTLPQSVSNMQPDAMRPPVETLPRLGAFDDAAEVVVDTVAMCSDMMQRQDFLAGADMPTPPQTYVDVLAAAESALATASEMGNLKTASEENWAALQATPDTREKKLYTVAEEEPEVLLTEADARTNDHYAADSMAAAVDQELAAEADVVDEELAAAEVEEGLAAAADVVEQELSGAEVEEHLAAAAAHPCMSPQPDVEMALAAAEMALAVGSGHQMEA